MDQYGLDQEISISTTIKHTKRDLVDAVALLTNARVIDLDECGRLADMIDSAYPSRQMQAARPGDIGCPGLDDFHPACEVCGKYIFAVDCCKGHRDEEMPDVCDRLEEEPLMEPSMYATDFMYKALVRRLVEIADAKDDDAVDDWARVGCYDMVAHAHEPNIREEE